MISFKSKKDKNGKIQGIKYDSVLCSDSIDILPPEPVTNINQRQATVILEKYQLKIVYSPCNKYPKTANEMIFRLDSREFEKINNILGFEVKHKCKLISIWAGGLSLYLEDN
jgi:hypothetical protein